MSEPAIYHLRRPPWWNLWHRYQFWRALRILRTGHGTRFYVPGEDRDKI